MQGFLFIAALILLATIIYEKIMEESTYAFIAHWHDDEASLTRTFRMLYFPVSNKIQLFEPKTQKMFLKKSTVDGLKSEDIFIGNTLVIHSRAFTIKDYADEFTRRELDGKTERTFAMLKPDSVKNMGKVIECIQQRGLKIRAATMAIMSEMHASEFYKEHMGKTFLPKLIEYVTSGPVLALQLQGENAVKIWRRLIGPTDPVQALAEDPQSLRARFGSDKTYNGFHGSDSVAAALREISIFFPSDQVNKRFVPSSSATFRNCTCCIVKPHVIQEGTLGPLLTAIQERGFRITGLEMIRFDKASASEFYEIYDGVLFEYMDMVNQLQSGPSIVLEITPDDQSSFGNDEPLNTVEAFRKLVGPMDPELARKIRPESLRARFGTTNIKNGLHCTDLEEDGVLEIEYVFKIMRGS